MGLEAEATREGSGPTARSRRGIWTGGHGMSRPGWVVRHVETLKSSFRILFGVIWGIDGAMKFSPALISTYPNMVAGMGAGQPAWLSGWFSFWAHASSSNPALIVYGTGAAELTLAFCLIAGFLRKLVYLGGIPFSLLIWGVAEGFGGPYGPGATDVGAAVMYAPAFLLLIVISATYGTSRFSLDAVIERTWPRWRLLAEWSGAGPASPINAEDTSSTEIRRETSGPSEPSSSHRMPGLPRPGRAWIAAGIVLIALVGAAYGVHQSWQLPAPGATGSVPSVEYVNLSVGSTPGTSGASFNLTDITVTSNATVIFTITVTDTNTYPVAPYYAAVQGTANGTEEVFSAPGVPMKTVTGLGPNNVSHTFTLEDGPYSLNVPLPAAASAASPAKAVFSAVFPQTGTFVWTCPASCVDGSQSVFDAGMGGVVTVAPAGS